LTDLNTFTPFTVIPDSLSVVDGKIGMEFPPSDDENFFFRVRIGSGSCRNTRFKSAWTEKVAGWTTSSSSGFGGV
jgi:hypothetical protein